MNIKLVILILICVAFTGCARQSYELSGPRHAEFKYTTDAKAGQLWLDSAKVLELRTASNAEHIIIYNNRDNGHEVVTVSIVQGRPIEVQRKVYDEKSVRIITYDDRGEVDVRARVFISGGTQIEDQNGTVIRIVSPTSPQSSGPKTSKSP